MKIIIVGNGLAGMEVASALRALNNQVEIEIIAREHYFTYARIRIGEIFGEEKYAIEDITLELSSWYKERNIKVRLAADAVAIDRQKKILHLENGTELKYDKLILATGAASNRLELPGSDLSGVYTLRECDDAYRIHESLRRHWHNVLVIGGGLLGLEAASHLKSGGARNLTVIESGPRILPRQLDEEGAAVLQKALENMGIEVRLGMKIKGFSGIERLEAAHFENGEQLVAQTVLMSMGVKPRTSLGQRAGLALGARGIIVNEFLQTSDPDIFAIGDCAEFKGENFCIIPVIFDQAPICAAAVLGAKTHAYAGTTPANTLKIVGIELGSFGQAVNEVAGAQVLRFSRGEGSYEKYVHLNGKFIGAIVIGSKERSFAAQALIGTEASAAVLHKLQHD